VDLGIKDILHSLLRVLKKGNPVAMTFYDIGHLFFERGHVKMKFSSKFLKELYDGTPSQRPTTPIHLKERCLKLNICLLNAHLIHI
jgi:hypothetical protein